MLYQIVTRRTTLTVTLTTSCRSRFYILGRSSYLLKRVKLLEPSDVVHAYVVKAAISIDSTQLNSTQVYYNLVVARPNSTINHSRVHKMKYDKHKNVHSHILYIKRKGKNQQSVG